MKFTIIYYSMPDGRNQCETVLAKDATKAAILVRETRGLEKDEFELIVAIEGEPKFATVDHTKINLFP
jgi:hypothetical protein